MMKCSVGQILDCACAVVVDGHNYDYNIHLIIMTVYTPLNVIYQALSHAIINITLQDDNYHYGYRITHSHELVYIIIILCD